MDTLSLALHAAFAAILVGPQVLLFYAVVPSTWLIDDEQLRSAVTRVVTRRFATLAVIALVGLFATGLYQFYQDDVVPEQVRENMMDFRWGLVFSTKMTLVLVLIAMIAVHGLYFGRRIREASDAIAAGRGDRARLEQLRRNSLLFSTLMVLVSIAIVMLGATLAHHPYSLQPR